MGVTQQLVNHWIRARRMLSFEQAIQIRKITRQKPKAKKPESPRRQKPE
jgi:hypothetical protein